MKALTRVLAICLFALQTAAQPSGDVMSADTPKTTVAGNTFIAPAGWSLTVRGNATILAAPEGSSRVALKSIPTSNTGA